MQFDHVTPHVLQFFAKLLEFATSGNASQSDDR
jgi:hypothetical protein